MASESNLKLTINFTDPELTPEERDEQAQRFIKELKDLDEIETVTRVPDPNPPEGNKSLGGCLVGLLTAEVNVKNAKHVFKFLSDRLGGKTIEVEIDLGEDGKLKKFKGKAGSLTEIQALMKEAENFVKGSK